MDTRVPTIPEEEGEVIAMGLTAIGGMYRVALAIAVGLSLQASAEEFEHRCDDRRAAELVARDLASNLPPNDAILKSLSEVYFSLVMREPHETPADHRFYYGTNLLQFGDLRLPSGRGPHPVAIVIHGGGWSSIAELHYMASVAAELQCMGVATWNIEYRRVGSGGEWPVLFQDVGAAADFLRDLAKFYPLDLNRVITIGQSAGGHLALWLAARHRIPSGAELYTTDPLRVVGAISLDGVPDLAAFQAAVPVPYVATFQKLLGGPNGATEDVVLQRMKQTSPAELLPLGVPQVLVHGDMDPSVPFFLIPQYMAQAQQKGDQVELFVIKGGHHFECADPANPQSGPFVRGAVRSLLGLGGGREEN